MGVILILACIVLNLCLLIRIVSGEKTLNVCQKYNYVLAPKTTFVFPFVHCLYNTIYTIFMHSCDAFVIKTNVCVNVCFVLHLFEFYILFVLVLCKLVQWFYYTLLAIRFITSSTYLYKIYILACVMYWFN